MARHGTTVIDMMKMRRRKPETVKRYVISISSLHAG